MGDRRWNLVSYHLEPNKATVFCQFTVGAVGAPTLMQYNYKTGLYTAAPTPGATNTFGIQAGARGVLSIVRNSTGNYTLKLQQSFTRFLQGLVAYKTLGTSVYPDTTFPFPESTIRLPVSSFTTNAQSGTVTISTITESGNTVTVTTGSAPSPAFAVGQLVQISGANITGPVVTGLAAYNGVYTITSVISTTSFTYTCPENGLAAGTAAGTAQILAGSPGPFLTMQFLNPTTGAAIELANGDIADVELDLGIGSGT